MQYNETSSIVLEVSNFTIYDQKISLNYLKDKNKKKTVVELCSFFKEIRHNTCIVFHATLKLHFLLKPGFVRK